MGPTLCVPEEQQTQWGTAGCSSHSPHTVVIITAICGHGAGACLDPVCLPQSHTCFNGVSSACGFPLIDVGITALRSAGEGKWALLKAVGGASYFHLVSRGEESEREARAACRPSPLLLKDWGTLDLKIKPNTQALKTRKQEASEGSICRFHSETTP